MDDKARRIRKQQNQQVVSMALGFQSAAASILSKEGGEAFQKFLSHMTGE